MSNIDLITAAAHRLREAAQHNETCHPVRELIGETDLELAYAVQDFNNDLRIKNGARMVGRKIGLTSESVQRQFGISLPDYGMLFHDMELMHASTIPIIDIMQPKAEAEIAFILGEDLDDPQIGAADVMSAVDFAVACIELPGSRIEGWDIKITDTIADNASGSHFVLGHHPVMLGDFDLLGCEMTMRKNGEIVSEGYGGACLGSPINAAVWLARKMAELGNPLKAGEIILSGALGPMCSVGAGDKIEVEIEELGEVSINLGE
ncbi:MAG: 2-keto-4-pentenoate hydratase [Limisphaerales bacterium]|jgi:2-keto-4-pentenoate hydratase